MDDLPWEERIVDRDVFQFRCGTLGTVTGPPAQGGIQILGSVPQFQEQVVAGFIVLHTTSDPVKVTDRDFVCSVGRSSACFRKTHCGCLLVSPCVGRGPLLLFRVTEVLLATRDKVFSSVWCFVWCKEFS